MGYKPTTKRKALASKEKKKKKNIIIVNKKVEDKQENFEKEKEGDHNIVLEKVRIAC